MISDESKYDENEDLSFKYITLPEDDVQTSLLRYVEEHDQDILVMMPRKHGLFERIFNKSISKKIALEIGIPLLTVHE